MIVSPYAAERVILLVKIATFTVLNYLDVHTTRSWKINALNLKLLFWNHGVPVSNKVIQNFK